MMYLIIQLTQNLSFACFPHLPSLLLHTFLQDLWWLLYVSPQLFVGCWDDLSFVPFFDTSSCLYPQTCLLFMQMPFKSQWLCLHLSWWESCLAGCHRGCCQQELSLVRRHVNGFSAPRRQHFSWLLFTQSCFFLFLSLHPQVYLSCSVWMCV